MDRKGNLLARIVMLRRENEKLLIERDRARATAYAVASGRDNWFTPMMQAIINSAMEWEEYVDIVLKRNAKEYEKEYNKKRGDF